MGDTSFPSVRFATTLRFIPKKGPHSKKGPLSGVLSTKMTLFGWRAGIQTRFGQTPLSHQKTFPSDTPHRRAEAAPIHELWAKVGDGMKG